MLYNHEKNLTATEERIKNSSINEANKRHIFEFESFCSSDGLKIARVLKHLTELKVLAEMVGQYSRSMPKQDMMTLVGRIQRMDREERTKQDYKSVIGKFFRWLGREDIVDFLPNGSPIVQGDFHNIAFLLLFATAAALVLRLAGMRFGDSFLFANIGGGDIVAGELLKKLDLNSLISTPISHGDFHNIAFLLLFAGFQTRADRESSISILLVEDKAEVGIGMSKYIHEL